MRDKDCGNEPKKGDIEKPYVILVEGKLDKIILELILSYIKRNHPDMKDLVSKTQVFNIGGKDKLKSAILENKINEAEEIIKAVLVILDKDESYTSTLQKIRSFLDKFDWIKLRDHLIIPDENSEGKELEDYLIDSLKETHRDLIHKLEECVDKVSSERKRGKKLFFTYLLLNDECNYEGPSINEDMIRKCINTKGLTLIRDKVIDFLNKVS